MTKEQFIYLVRESVIPAATRGVISSVENPPGRNPSEEVVQLSEWFNSLSDADKSNVAKLVENAADECLFGVCAVLDGVRVIDKDTDRFEISQINYNGKKEVLSGELDYHDLC